MRGLVVVVVALGVAALPACPSGHLTPGTPTTPTPGDGTATPVGTASTLDVGAWNLKNFPCGNASTSLTCRGDADKTPGIVAKLMGELRVDLFSVEEIDDENAFHEVVAALPGYDGILSTHTYFDGTYQKVGFIYDTAVLDAGTPTLLFESDDSFPRPPLEVPFTWKGPGAPLSFVAVAVHLKAGSNPDDIVRRGRSFVALEQHARDLVRGGDLVIFMGDFNETLTSSSGLQNFAPFSDPSLYDIRTLPAANAGLVSFLPSDVILDHIITTASFADAVGGHDAVIPRIDGDVPDYLGRVSDHIPVFLTVGAP